MFNQTLIQPLCSVCHAKDAHVLDMCIDRIQQPIAPIKRFFKDFNNNLAQTRRPDHPMIFLY